MNLVDFKDKVVEIRQAIDRAKTILLHLHPSPDPDSVGSVLALAEYCDSLGKMVTVIGGDSELSTTMAIVPGFDRILSKSYADINPADFDLFLILDSGAVGMISKKGEVVFPANMTTVVIDHHATNTGYGQINLINTEAPATAQIVHELLAEWGATITTAMASNLYAGLHGDTGGFRYGNTTPRTMVVASKLLEINPLATKLILDMGRAFPKGLLRYKALAFSVIEEILAGRGALITLSYDDLNKAGIDLADTEAASLSNELLSVKDWLLGVTLVEKEAGRVRVSLRSKDANLLDVSKVAVALGGGGHPLAAGILLLMPIDEAKEKVIEMIEKNFTKLT